MNRHTCILRLMRVVHVQHIDRSQRSWLLVERDTRRHCDGNFTYVIPSRYVLCLPRSQVQTHGCNPALKGYRIADCGTSRRAYSAHRCDKPRSSVEPQRAGSMSCALWSAEGSAEASSLSTISCKSSEVAVQSRLYGRVRRGICSGSEKG